MSSVNLTVPYPPSLNALHRSQIIGMCGTCRKCPVCAKTRRAAPFKSAEYQTYEQQIMSVLERNERPRILKPDLVAVTASVYRPRAIGDLDNTFKALLDVLSGHVYEDDGQIAELHAYRHEGKERPRVELIISPIASSQGSLL